MCLDFHLNIPYNYFNWCATDHRGLWRGPDRSARIRTDGSSMEARDMAEAIVTNSPLMTVKEAAAYLRMSVRQLYNLRSDERPLVPVKIGARTLYRRQDLDQFIDQHRRSPNGHDRT